MESTPKNNTNKNSNNNSTNNPNEKKIIKVIVEKILKSSQTTVNRSGEFIECLLSKNESKLFSLCEKGLPDDLPILRSLIWKIYFNYLPINFEEWDSILQKQRESYFYFKNLFLEKLRSELTLYENYNDKSKEEKRDIDKKTNKNLLEEICKDVNRTHTQLSLFYQPINDEQKLIPTQINEMIDNRHNCTLKNINDIYKLNIIETHADVMARILFIYSKLKPDLSYVQGMNEIIAPIYYVYSIDNKIGVELSNINDIEADCFWSFYNLMELIRDVFNRDKDYTDEGVKGKAERLKLMLTNIDEDLNNHLDKYGLDYSTFAFKWFILFFSQDYNMVDILKLWDYIFVEKDKFENVYFVGLAILEMKKEELMESDLTGMIQILQNSNDLLIEDVIENAKTLKKEFGSECLAIMNNTTDKNEK